MYLNRSARECDSDRPSEQTGPKIGCLALFPGYGGVSSKACYFDGWFPCLVDFLSGCSNGLFADFLPSLLPVDGVLEFVRWFHGWDFDEGGAGFGGEFVRLVGAHCDGLGCEAGGGCQGGGSVETFGWGHVLESRDTPGSWRETRKVAFADLIIAPDSTYAILQRSTI